MRSTLKIKGIPMRLYSSKDATAELEKRLVSLEETNQALIKLINDKLVEENKPGLIKRAWSKVKGVIK